MERYARMAGQHPFPKAIKILLSTLAALVLIVIAGLLYLGTPYFAAQAGTWLTHRSGRNVVLQGRIEAHWWSLEPHFILHDVKVGNAEWGSEPTMFEAKQLEFSIQLTQLLRGRLV
ncbi:MAG: AsmA family protein, partial [Pseudomonadota bacterium]|nr:AsmA family protein [Pseudomonadota bacterium]